MLFHDYGYYPNTMHGGRVKSFGIEAPSKSPYILRPVFPSMSFGSHKRSIVHDIGEMLRKIDLPPDALGSSFVIRPAIAEIIEEKYFPPSYYTLDYKNATPFDL